MPHELIYLPLIRIQYEKQTQKYIMHQNYWDQFQCIVLISKSLRKDGYMDIYLHKNLFT